MSIRSGLLVTLVLIASVLWLPAAASAAVTTTVDVEQSPVLPVYEEQTPNFTTKVRNTGDATTGDVVVTFTQSGAQAGNISVSGAIGFGCSAPAFTVTCRRSFVDFPMGAGESVDFSGAMTTYFSASRVDSTATIAASVSTTGASTQSDSVQFTVIDKTPVCVGVSKLDNPFAFSDELTMSEARAGQTGSISLNCTAPAGGSLSLVHAADTPSASGTIDITGVVRSPDGRTRSGTITYTPSASAVTAGRSISDVFKLNLRTSINAKLYPVQLTFALSPQADLVTATSVPTSVEVAPGGTSSTFTANLRNAGPDTAFDTNFFWELSDRSTVVAATAGSTTCTRLAGLAQGVESGKQVISCPIASIPAGGSVPISVTLSYQPGSNGLVLPSTETVIGTTFRNSSSIGDADETNPADNSVTSSVSLTAAPAPTCAAGQPGTPPNCGSGTEGSDRFIGGPSNDNFNGGGGNDRFIGNAGSDTFRGGAGSDFGLGGLGNDKMFGGIGNDTLDGGAGNDATHGEAGNDKLYGGAGNDLTTGGSGNDIVRGDAGNDRSSGGIGNDTVNGGPGNDITRGEAGADKVACGSGSDKAYGDSGNDVVNCKDGRGGDLVNGGAGKDICVGDAKDAFVSCETVRRS